MTKKIVCIAVVASILAATNVHAHDPTTNDFDKQECKTNADGSVSCKLVATAPTPTAPNGLPWPTPEECSQLEFALAGGFALLAFSMLAQPEMVAIWIVGGFGLDAVKWYFGC